MGEDRKEQGWREDGWEKERKEGRTRKRATSFPGRDPGSKVRNND